MKVSVFVVTYNQEQYIGQCLSSIMSQVVDFDYEVIVGDDCSTDGTPAICDAFAREYPNVKVYHHPKNLGHVKNWEFVLRQCQGDFVAMLEGDDYWIDDHKLQQQVDFLERNEEYILSFHQVKLVYDEPPQVKDHLFEQLEEREYGAREIYETWTVLTSSVVFRNHVVDYSFPQGVFFSDIFLFLSLLEHGRAWCHKMCAVAYRRHGCNQSSSQSIQLAERLYKQYRIMEKRFPALCDISHKNKQSYLYDMAYHYSHEPKAVRYMLLYMSLHPAKLFSIKYWRRLFSNVF